MTVVSYKIRVKNQKINGSENDKDSTSSHKIL